MTYLYFAPCSEEVSSKRKLAALERNERARCVLRRYRGERRGIASAARTHASAGNEIIAAFAHFSAAERHVGREMAARPGRGNEA